MRTVTAMELRRRLGEILDAAAAGEPITIERDGRPMAVLVTPEAAAVSTSPSGPGSSADWRRSTAWTPFASG